ncbi:MAG: hypothetical protein NTV00_14355 [Methylococcales bacterium]|nr:hypothetical protein [Methylococcales bacterium]
MHSITRVKAGLIHFCLSLTIFSIIFFILFTLWYPEPYFTASGGWQGLKIAAAIDVVLGPLLTLIIFNPQKSARVLSMDLAVIAFFQTAALVWGIFTIYQQRPVAVVFWEDSFMTVAAIDLNRYNYPLEQLQQLSKLNPPLIYVEKPKDVEGLKQLLSKIQDSEIPPHHQTDLYRPLVEHFAEIASQQLPIDKALEHTPTLRPQLDKLLSESKHTVYELQYYLLKAKYHDIILAFTPAGELVGHLTPPQKSLPVD